MKFRIRSPLLFLMLLVALVSAFGAFASPPCDGPCIAFAVASPHVAGDLAPSVAPLPDIVTVALAIHATRELANEHYYFDSMTRETYSKTPAVVRLFRDRERAQRTRPVPIRRLFRVTPARLAG